MGTALHPAEVEQLLGRAHELGVNLVDTAECYGDHLAEALIGGAIRTHRDDWVVATKFGHRFHPDALQQGGGSPSLLRSEHWSPAEVVAPLGALRTDQVDLYQMHSGADEVFDRHDLWEALHQQVAKGKIRHLGVSLGGDDVDQARRVDQVGADVAQVGYNRLDRSAEQGVLPACLDQDLGGDRPGTAGQRLPERHLSAGRLGHRPRRLALGSRPGRGPAQAGAGRGAPPDRGARGDAHGPGAIGWCLRHPAVSCVVAGSKSVQQLEANAAAADLDLVRDAHPRAAIP
jgi:aryl-alcohol dehydrogenase-like predicted oxidoreductase